ncbi:MAG: 6-bladed beta-propeller [Balneolaceae bacterium]|nr:6-bladed beta-propeller [Balneolaceae bacterium]
MTIQFKSILFCILSITFIVSCESNSSMQFGTESEVLKTLIDETSLNTINLDQIPITDISLGPENIIQQDSVDADLLLTSPTNTFAKGERVYITDLRQPTVLIADTSNTIIDAIGRKGRGPGEFESVSAIFSSEEHIFIADGSLSRVNQYEYDTFNYIKSFNIYVGLDDLAASNNYIFASTRSGAKNLTQVYNNAEPYAEYDSLLPRLIPMGKEPSGYNTFQIDATNGVTMAAYPGFPYLFLFDDNLNLTSTIQFTADSFSDIDNPEAIPVDNIGRMEGAVRRYITDFKLSESGHLYAIIDNTLTIIDTNNNYEVEGRYDIRDRTKGNESISMSFISQSDGRVYLNSISHPAIYVFDRQEH